MFDNLNYNLDKLPESNGIYIFKDKKERIIYIGKSKNLNKRVKSYFTNSSNKAKKMVSLLDSIDFIRTSTELEALLLEDELIKKHRPDFNRKQKDFAKYRYFSFKGAEYPALLCGGEPVSDEFYGPFVRQNMAENVFQLLSDNLMLRTCRDDKPQRKCIRRDMSFCLAPCSADIGDEYHTNVKIAQSYLRGESPYFVEFLRTKMVEYSEDLEFEKAQVIKNSLKMLNGYFYRQEFFQKFSSSGVYVETVKPKPLSYLFFRGNLLGISKALYSKAELRNMLNNRLSKYRYIDKYNNIERYDRANIVFTWVMNSKGSYIYVQR